MKVLLICWIKTFFKYVIDIIKIFRYQFFMFRTSNLEYKSPGREVCLSPAEQCPPLKFGRLTVLKKSLEDKPGGFGQLGAGDQLHLPHLLAGIVRFKFRF